MKINLLGYCVLVASLVHATLSYPSQENIYNPAYMDDYFSPTEPAQLEPDPDDTEWQANYQQLPSNSETIWNEMEQQAQNQQINNEDGEIDYPDTDLPTVWAKMEQQANLEEVSFCARYIYVMGFTSGRSGAGSDNSAYLFLDLTNHEDGYVKFPDNPGDDYVANKGDLFQIRITDFKFKLNCVRKCDINKVVIHNGGNDGWHIASVVTMLNYGSYYSLLTVNIGLNDWVDGNGAADDHQKSLRIV